MWKTLVTTSPIGNRSVLDVH